MENIKCNCDICKFGESHDYLPNQYWCRRFGVGTTDKKHNCSFGEINQSRLEWVTKLNDGKTEFSDQIIEKRELTWSDLHPCYPHPETCGDFYYSNPADNK